MVPSHRQVVADLLGITLEQVEDSRWLTGSRDRFTYFVARLNEGRRGFVKLSADPALKMSLAREAFATDLARQLGLPVAEVIHFPSGRIYEERQGMGVVVLELLDPAHWRFFQGCHDLPDLERETVNRLVEAGVETILAMSGNTISGKAIPVGIDLRLLDHEMGAGPRHRSPELLNQHWDKCEVVLSKLGNVFVQHTEEKREWLEGLVRQARDDIVLLTKTVGNPSQWYFMHGDFSPGNLSLSVAAAKPAARPIDLEFAVATRYQALAKLCDIANFAARCWPNQILQESFIRSMFLAEKERGVGGAAFCLMRTAIVTGTFNLARFAMDPSHPEHTMSHALLGRLEKNLRVLSEAASPKNADE